MISLGILSWHAHETLRRTLSSYGALLPLVDEKVIYFNEINDSDRALAAEYGFEARGTTENLGILGGTRALVASLTGDLVICCQNDNPVFVTPVVLAARLADAQKALTEERVRWVRLRNRFAMGFSDRPKHLRYWGDSFGARLRRIFRPWKACYLRGRAVDAVESPEKLFPTVFSRAGSLFISSSKWVNYSDQPFMTHRHFALDLLTWAEAHADKYHLLNGHSVPEIVLNSSGYWCRHNFPVAVSEGIFEHARWDDSFRADNPNFNRKLVTKEG